MFLFISGFFSVVLSLLLLHLLEILQRKRILQQLVPPSAPINFHCCFIVSVYGTTFLCQLNVSGCTANVIVGIFGGIGGSISSLLIDKVTIYMHL